MTGLPKIRDVKKSINKRTAAILITHLYSDSNQITKFINKFSGKVKIIEDTAINFGASINKFRKLGTLADYGFFSLGNMKILWLSTVEFYSVKIKMILKRLN